MALLARAAAAVCLALGFASIAPAAEEPPEIASRDLVVEAVPMPEAPTDAVASIDWTNGVLRVTGKGLPPDNVRQALQRRAMARTAARNVALRNLVYALQGAPVTSDDTFAEHVKRQGGSVQIEGFVRIDRIDEERTLPDGSVVATVELDLRNKPDVAQVLYAPAKEEAPKPQLRPKGSPLPAGLTPAGAKGPFTGLIVVATGLNARPILRPAIFDAAGKRLYGPGVVDMEFATRQGLADYARTVGGAMNLVRVGPAPLVVAAAGVNARNPGELILSKEDAQRVRAADAAGKFLKQGAVAVVVEVKER